jgi:hypothetical protein
MRLRACSRRIFEKRGPSIFPIERLFLQRVKVADEQNQEKRNHRAENHIPRRVVGEHVPINDRPRKKKNDFDVEQDEQHSDEIKFDGKARASFADGIRAAFVGGVFCFGARGEFAEQEGQCQNSDRETNGGGEQNQNRNVLRKLRISRIFHARNLWRFGKNFNNEMNVENYFLNSQSRNVKIPLKIRHVTIGK